MASGSYLVISHPTHDAHPEVAAAAREVYDEVDAPLVHRGHTEISRLFEGFEVLDPGVTEVADWRPESELDANRIGSEWWYVGVGRKP
jgi:hypothetical protein